MSFRRIYAIILQELYVTRHSLEVIVDLFYFSIINIFVYGFFSLYLTGTNKQAAHYLLLGMILWEIVRVTQYSVSVGSLWNIWSRNLSNVFVSPISATEYMMAEILSGIVKALLIVFAISFLAIFIFHFNFFSIGIVTFIAAFINLSIFSWSVGLFILGLIFRYGNRIQALAWGLVFLFQPLSATFFPVTILPLPLQHLAYALPSTYVFEAARKSLSTHTFDMRMAAISFGLNIIYLLFTIVFFNYMFRKSKDSGQFAKNEG